MDGDPSQEDRIRLIGRLFFQLGGRRLKLRTPFCILLVQVLTQPVADQEIFRGHYGQICAVLWAIKLPWTFPQ